MQKHYIFDIFKGQTTPAVGNLLHKYNCFVICVPSYYTDNFQTLDNFLTKVQNVSLQTSNCKLLDYSTADNLIAKHQDWFANEVLKQLTRAVEPHDVK